MASNFLVANNSSDNVLVLDASTGKSLGEFITSGLGGLEKPDTLIFGPDGNGDGRSDLYISSGAKPETSSILRFDGLTGEFIDTFVGDDLDTTLDETGGLIRPYGMTFGPDGNLYVASFLSDRILRYDGTTGDFIDVVAQGNGEAGGLNGPNGLLFIDGSLYVTTQGSIATTNLRTGEVFPDFRAGLPSQVLRYDSLETGFEPTVFATPTPSPSGFGFVSLLGLQLGEDGDLYVSDLASDIRRYDLETGELIDTLSTNYTPDISPSNNFFGSLAFAPNGDLLTVGFDRGTEEGTVLRYESQNGSPVNPLQVLSPTNPTLKRPIGITFFPDEPLQPIFGTNESESLDGTFFNDTIIGGRGKDNIAGNYGDDILLGNEGKDNIAGNYGDDILLGNEGKDFISGGAGNDTLLGGNGADKLRGGLGEDELIGGKRRDTFILAAGEATDTIIDFSTSDVIGLADGLTFSELSFSGSNIIVTANNEVLATLTGINTTTLNTRDFITV